MNFKKTFKNKKVLITGHTGFKGAWLTLWLLHCGAKIMGISKERNVEGACKTCSSWMRHEAMVES